MGEHVWLVLQGFVVVVTVVALLLLAAIVYHCAGWGKGGGGGLHFRNQWKWMDRFIVGRYRCLGHVALAWNDAS